jgi:hypothetical protein
MATFVVQLRQTSPEALVKLKCRTFVNRVLDFNLGAVNRVRLPDFYADKLPSVRLIALDVSFRPSASTGS